jgi:hypothetical protein
MTTILEQAAAIVDSDREKTYGNPDKNLKAIAEFWEAWLRARGKLAHDAFLTFEDVACMMSLLKTARLANDPRHKDSPDRRLRLHAAA